MEKGFDKDGFFEWLKEEFPGCLDNHFNYELVNNIINYGFKWEMVSKDQLAEWISDMLPEVTFFEVARFMEPGHLTAETQKMLEKLYK